MYLNKPTTTDRAVELVACYGLVGSAILYAVCRFWNFTWVPVGLLLTPPFIALSFLLSRVALRVEEAIKNEAWMTLAVVTVQGLFCLFFESAMVHMGLEWLNQREHFAPELMMWPASAALSLFNVGSVFAFARSIPAPKREPMPEANPAKLLADKRWAGKKAA